MSTVCLIVACKGHGPTRKEHPTDHRVRHRITSVRPRGVGVWLNGNVFWADTKTFQVRGHSVVDVILVEALRIIVSLPRVYLVHVGDVVGDYVSGLAAPHRTVRTSAGNQAE